MENNYSFNKKNKPTVFRFKIALATIVLLFSVNTSKMLAQTIITGFAPSSGPVGTTVTITGNNFSTIPSNNIVFFGATMATVSSGDSTFLTVTVPTGASYQYISVTNLTTGLTAYSSKAFIPTFSCGGDINSNSYTAKSDVATDVQPTNVGIGDLDGDGKADLIVTNASNTISIYRNTSTIGTILFAPKINFTTVGSNYSVAIGDLDGDGKLDFATVNDGPNSISVFRNASTIGNITLDARVDFAAGMGPHSIVMGDLDGDGKPDLATANSNSNSVSVYRNISSIGTISFDPKLDYTVGSLPKSIAIGDLNEDGLSDLFTANYNANTVSILKNISSSGTISFAAKVDEITGAGPWSIALGDLDGDGKTDLTVTNYNNPSTVSVLRNSSIGGTVSFDSKVDFVTGSSPYSITISDLNGDGKPDLATANASSATAALFKNTCVIGTISFAPKTDITAGTFAYSVSANDLDGDGKPDLVVANNLANTISLYRNIIYVAPNMTSDNSTTICSGDSINMLLTSDMAATYSWIASDNPNSTGESTTTKTSNTLSDTITNNTTSVQTVIYTATPTSVTGNCIGTPQTITVTINPSPSVNSTDVATICSGSTVNIPITSAVASSYSWIANDNINTTGESITSQSTSTLSNTIINNTSSVHLVNYFVIPTSTNGSCVGTSQTLTVTINPLPISNAGNDLTICSGMIGNIGAAAVAGYSYSWNSSVGLSDSTVSFPVNTTINGTSSPISTTYTVTTSETATGCQSIDSAVITVNPQPVLSVTNPPAECFLNTVDITTAGVTAGSTGGGSLSYWKNAGATISLSSPNAIAISDTNYIKVIALGGCTDIDSVITIINPLPISNAGNNLTICSGIIDSIGSTAIAGYSYSWNTSFGLSDSTVSFPINTTINGTNTPIVTTYTVTTTKTATGCKSIDSTVITVNPQPVLTITNPAAACFPNTVDITAAGVTAGSTGGGTLSYWIDAGATISLTLPNAIAINDTNYIKVIALGGCTDFDSVITIINSLPIVNSSGLAASYCYNASSETLVGSPAGGTFSGNGINGSDFTPSIAGSGVDTITYTYSDGNSCANTSSQYTEVLEVPSAPDICMVTVDSASNYNVIYWDKTSYTNIDSFIVYRETVTNTYKRIGSVSIDSTSLLVDTVRQLYFPYTGDPNIGTYRYKLQIIDTCGNYSLLSPYHNTIYVSQTGGNFNWNNYQIENQPTPINGLSAYQLLRDDFSTGNWTLIGGVSGSQLTISDPTYASFPNASWRIETSWSISCSPTRAISTTRSNTKTQMITTGIASSQDAPSQISIYPNPYSGNTTISYSLSNKSDVIVEIYTAIGQKLETVVNTSQIAGEYKYNFSAKEKGYKTGVYFVKISMDGTSSVRRIVEME